MAVNSVGRTTIQGATTVGGFNPATLFSAGEQGVWYDPSDLSTLFQDSAGTIPVTALEQPVGRMLDKSGRGNHATQSTNTSFRPVVSARVNLFTYSEDFLDTATAGSTRPWSWIRCTSSATTVTLAPNGTATAFALNDTNGGGLAKYVYQTYTTPITQSLTVSFFVKKGSKNWSSIRVYDGSIDRTAYYDLVNGVLGTVDAGVTATISDAGYGWYRITHASSYTAAMTPLFQVLPAVANNVLSYIGTGAAAIYIWGADLRPTNQGVGLPVYQRVGAATYGTSTTVGNADYNANGFPVYLKFDGSNDFLQAASYTMPLINRMTMVGFAEDAAVANQGCVSVYPATGDDYGSQTGYVFTPGDRVTIRFAALGTPTLSYWPQWNTSPASIIPASVITEDKQTSAGYLRVNGTQVGSDTSFTQFSANSNGGLLLGARWLSSAVAAPYLNGRIYGVIVRGASSTANQITGAENWLNQKTAAY